MRNRTVLAVLTSVSIGIHAQQPVPQSISAVPQLVRITGSYKAADPASLVNAKFSIYREEHGGTALWTEVQNVRPDNAGAFTVVLGSTRNEGLPADLFDTGEPRWLEVEIDRTTQPRVLMTSVPYALRAADADTLGGLPPSAYLRADNAAASSGSPTMAGSGKQIIPVRDGAANGSPNCLALFTNTTDIVCSAINQGTVAGNPAASIGLPASYLGAMTLVGNVPFGDAAGMALYNAGAGAGASVSLDMYNTPFNSGIPQAKIKAVDDGAYSDHLTFWLKRPGAPSNPITERLRIASYGYVGIGTPTPQAMLDVAGSIRFTSGALVFPDGTSQTTAAGNGGGGVTTVSVGTTITGNPGSQASVTNTGTNTNAVLNFTIPQGALGPAGTVSIGTTTTGAPGSQASVTNTGGPSAAVLNFTIPQGQAGPNVLALGSATAPSLSFAGNSGNGIFSAGTDTFNIATGGASRLAVLSNGDVDLPGSVRKSGTLFLHSLGTANLAVGLGALSANGGSFNTAVGPSVLLSNTTGGYNTAAGSQALTLNTTGSNNTVFGAGALQSNTTGASNTANGSFALQFNQTGPFNTANGSLALQANTTGSSNTADGTGALQNNTTGNFNTGAGAGALQNLAVGSSNIAIGGLAGQNLVTGSGNIYLGHPGVNGDSSVLRIGPLNRVFIAGIRGVTTGLSDAVNVGIDSNGQLGTFNSSRRFKKEIQSMGDATSNLMKLRPVTYRYKQPYADGSEPIQYGLIAEEVAEVYPELVAHSADGQIETVKYQMLDSMLLNEWQKQQVKISSQSAEIKEQQEKIRSLEQRLHRLESLLDQSPVGDRWRD